eukprot:TRINITY_DN8862_c0_g1_i2.p1 TRINITY_DN8862_c0_g1~~TRINITY_DN8862_c0_g1_i2.p1  ORF type:complete len:206 (-),score=57.56 TRINITY_DN8862_c0_g1_i2:198-767(-)
MGCTAAEDESGTEGKRESLKKKHNPKDSENSLINNSKNYSEIASGGEKESIHIIGEESDKPHRKECITKKSVRDCVQDIDEAAEKQSAKEIETESKISFKQTEQEVSPQIKIEVIEESKSQCNDSESSASKDPKEVLLALGYDLQTDYDDDDKRQNPVRQLVIPYSDEAAERICKQSTNEGDSSGKKLN